MAQSASRFVWHELMTTDTEAAKTYYTKVVEWGTQPVSGMPYTLFTAAQIPTAGLMDLPEEARKVGAPPHWLGYVGVADVDASTAKAKGLGATIYVEPRDIPDIGRFSVFADPQGAAIAIFKEASPPTHEPPPQNTPGRVGWNELMADDWEKALAFYSEMFGWQKADAIDMGEMGTYQLFATGGQTIGGMFNKPPAVPRPFWLYYFNVGNIDAAIERLKAAGGKVMNGPMEVPGGDWIAQATDPQGAMFALVGKRA